MTIPSGTANAAVTIIPIADELAEPAETVRLSLSLSSTYTVVSPSYAEVVIAESGPEVTISAESNGSEQGPANGILTVTRTGATSSALTVYYTVATSQSTAVQGTDFWTLPGSLTIPANASSATIAVTPIDDSLAESSESVCLAVSADTHYRLGASSRATIQILDNEPTVTIAATADAKEGAANGVFTVTRSGGNTANPLTVQYTVAGTAESGTDFTALAGNVTIAAGSTSATITVVPAVDGVPESKESVIVGLTADSGPSYSVRSPASATVWIVDGKPTVEITVYDSVASEAGPDQGQLRVQRNGGDWSLPQVVFYTVTGNATSGADYVALGGSVTIPVNAASAIVDVIPLDDSVIEANETVTVTLAADLGYTIGSQSNAAITIQDNDSVVTVEATDANASEEGLNPGQFTFRRSSESTQSPLTINYWCFGTATAGVDYTGVNYYGTVTISAGATTAVLTVTPIDDTVGESDETVSLYLNQGPYKLGDPRSATITIADNEPIVTIEASDANAAETVPDTGTFTVSRTGGNLAAPLTVYFGSAALPSIRSITRAFPTTAEVKGTSLFLRERTRPRLSSRRSTTPWASRMRMQRFP